MQNLKTLEVWFVTGSQHLYGPEALRQVSANAEKVASGLGTEAAIPVAIVFKPIVTTTEEIRTLCRQASERPECYRFNFVDAYLFSGKNVDRRLDATVEANLAFAYPI